MNTWLTTSTILADLRDENREGGESTGKSWDSLYAHFRGPIAQMARGMGLSAADAEDVTQESLLVLHSALREGRYDRARGRLSSYLLGIVHRTALAARKRSAGRTKRNDGNGRRAEGDGESAELPSADAERAWEVALLRQCVTAIRGEVEPHTWNAFDLVVNRGVPAPAAAQQLGVPLTVIYNAKHRVLKRLREVRAQIDD